MRERLISLFFLVLCIVFFINIIRSWVHLEGRRKGLKETERKLENLQDSQEDLQRKLAGMQTADYLEKQAREKLNLGRPDEFIVLLPSISPIVEPTPEVESNLAVWQQWVRIFF